MKKVFLLGDSTCAVKEEEARPETGWGEMFAPYLRDGWTLVNLARNGRSTEMILLEGIFYDCFWQAERGDWVLIQFGHNENKKEVFRYTDPDGKFVFNLCYMAGNLLKKGVHVVFLSPISRRHFENGRAVSTHFGYPEAMRRTAAALGLPFVELTEKTLAILNETGDEESKKWFMNFPAGVYENWPDGKSDDTHLRPEGARWIASLVYEGLRSCEADFLRQEKDEQ